jgi:hypothetical protein
MAAKAGALRTETKKSVKNRSVFFMAEQIKLKKLTPSKLITLVRPKTTKNDQKRPKTTKNDQKRNALRASVPGPVAKSRPNIRSARRPSAAGSAG